MPEGVKESVVKVGIVHGNYPASDLATAARSYVPGELGQRSEIHHLNDVFKKKAAPRGIAVACPGRQPGQGFRPVMILEAAARHKDRPDHRRKPARRPSAPRARRLWPPTELGAGA